MLRGSLRGILGWTAVLAMVPSLIGCVAAYDPSIPARLTMDTRAEELGLKEPRPVTKQPKRQAKPATTPTAVAATSTEPGKPTNVTAAPVKPVQQAEARPQSETQAQVQAQPEPRPEELPGTTSVKAPPRAEPPPAPKTIPAPATAAGKQLAWWLAILSGGPTKGLEDHFAASFLEKVPGNQVRAIARQWQQDELAGGPADLVELEDETATSVTALVRGRATDRYTKIKLAVDDAGKIRTLWLGPLIGFKRGEIQTWADLDAKLATFRGTVSLAAQELSGATLRRVHERTPDERLAIGSTFKLWILGALAEEVLAGRAKWDEPLAISDDLKSLPSGRMQLENEGAEFPLSTYADLMISISDNTAADHLLHRVGREKVEAYMAKFSADPKRNLPLLSTMEMFRLKLGPDRTLATRYIQADEAGRRAMLAPDGEIAKTTPSFAALTLWKAPYLIEELEWFATTPECCKLMADIAQKEQQPGMEPLGHALRINPGLQFDRRVWPGVAYKGGSEPGVLNMTWLLERDDGKVFTLSLTCNDTKKDVDIKQAADLVSAAVSLLADEGAR